MDTAKWVKGARAHAQLTQAALGDFLGVTKANVSGWETGRHEPSYSQMLKIKDRTGYPLPHEWPMSLVDMERWLRLSPEGRGYVQKAMNDALDQCEQSGRTRPTGNRLAA